MAIGDLHDPWGHAAEPTWATFDVDTPSETTAAYDTSVLHATWDHADVGADDIARARGAGACGIGNSFLPMTMVLMANGTHVPIEDVDVGDFVWATDPETGEAGPRQVLDLIEGEGWKDMVVVTVNGQQVTATTGHPFWVEGRDVWMDAGDLEAGHRVLTSDGSELVVESVVTYQAVERVHNLHVDDLHTYYVQFGDEDVLVHNCKLPKDPKDVDRLLNVKGKVVPDGTDYPGRGKIKWKLGKGREITYENHGYDPRGPYSPRHHGPHYHLNEGGSHSRGYLPGEPFPKGVRLPGCTCGN